MRNRKHIHGRSGQRLIWLSRSGSVQFELAMFLPLYAILLLTLLTLCSFMRTSQSTVIQARQNAWLQQQLTGAATQTLPVDASGQLGRILHDSQPADGGLLLGNAQRSPMSLVRFFQPASESRYSHYVLTDPWDYRVLEFEDKRRHTPLQLDRRQAAFGQLDSGGFRQLIPGLLQNAGSAAQQLQRARQFQQQAQRRLKQGSQILQQQLQNEQRRLNSLQQQLTEASGAVPANSALIADLRNRVQVAQANMERLRRQQQLVRDGQNLMKTNKF